MWSSHSALRQSQNREVALSVLLRPARGGDVGSLADIYRSSAAHHVAIDPKRYRVPDRESVAEHFREALVEDGGDAIIVAEEDGVVVGFLHLRAMSDPPAYSMVRPQERASLDLAVLDGFRGRGVGTALLAAAVEWAKSRSLQALVLDALLANAGAVALYERHGYQPFGTLMENPLR